MQNRGTKLQPISVEYRVDTNHRPPFGAMDQMSNVTCGLGLQYVLL